MKIQHATDTHASERHDRGEAPRSIMYSINRLNELYRELDEILTSVTKQPSRFE